MRLEDYIEKNKVDYTKNLVSVDDIEGIENEVGVSFGAELIKYSLKYGYLAYKHVEFYGVNSKQLFDSDMVKQTKYLHKYFPKTLDYIALENSGDGNYVLVASDDTVYVYSTEDDRIISTKLKLFDYITKRFRDIDID